MNFSPTLPAHFRLSFPRGLLAVCGRGRRAKREKLAVFSYLLLFSLVCSHFLLFLLVCTMGNSPADFNMSLRHGVVFSRAGGLCCVLSVCLANSSGGFSAGGRGGAGLQRSATYGRHGMEWGVAEKRPPPSPGRVGLFLHIHQTLPRAGVAEKQGMAFRGLCPEFLSGAYEDHGKA